MSFNKERISQFLSGNITDEERKQFLSEIEKDKDRKTEYIKYLNLWKLSLFSCSKPPISFEQKVSLFNRFWKQRNKNLKSAIIIRKSLRYAAIITVALSLGCLVQFVIGTDAPIDQKLKKQQYKLTNNFGSISLFQLKDGSKVWLNTNTSLTITEMENKWMVHLEGEAYFDVIHDEEREFQINLGDVVILDRGTRFNIKAYPEDSIFRTVLLDGEIEIRERDKTNKVNLKKGEGYIYNRNSRMADIKEVDGSFEASWKDGKFVFIDKSLRQICDNLGKWYNVEFTFRDQEMANTRYTCMLKRTTTVNQLMKLLKTTSDINYEIINNENSKDVINLK